MEITNTHLKEMTLQDIQHVSLDILKHLHAFCNEHGIKYSLGYGTLIGAVRHKGFIPWDDDIDVVMLRDDYQRFCKIYQDTPDFKLFCSERGNMYGTLGRLCDMKRTLVKTGSPLFTEPTGVWIDIFPLDSVPDDRKAFDLKTEEFKTIHKEIINTRWALRPWDGKDRIKGRVHQLYNRCYLQFRLERLVKKHNRLCLTWAKDNTKMISMLVYPVYIDRDHCSKSVLDEVIFLPFEGSLFYVMKGYDEWLRIIYGDYMQLPPVEKRVPGHSLHLFFWK